MNTIQISLLKLVADISTQESEEKVISLFIHGINTMFSGFDFEWQKQKQTKNAIVIATEKNYYGSIRFTNKNQNEDNDIVDAISPACVVVASILESKKKRNSIVKTELKTSDKELREAKEKAEENENYITMLFNESPVGLALTEMTGELVEVNKEYARIVGYSIEETQKLKYWDLTPEKYLEQEQQQLQSLKEKGEYGPFEKEYIHKSGKLIPVRLSGKIIVRNGMKYIWSSVEDITEEKSIIKKIGQQTKELIEAKEQSEKISASIAAIIENTDSSIWSINRDYELTYINHVFESEFKQSFDIQLKVGLNLLESLPDIIKPLWKERYDRALKGEKFIFEDKVEVLNNVFVYIQVAMNPIIADGEIIGASFFGSNITDRKNKEVELTRAKEQAEKSEEQLRLISDNFVNGMLYQVVSFDDDSRKFTYLSEVVTKFYGCSVEEAKADPNLIYGRIHKDDIAQLISDEQTAIASMNVFKSEARVINPNGTIRWSYFVSQPRIIEGNIHWDGIEVDITDRKNQELELKNAKEKAEESDRLKSEFINNLSHEIRTPMNGIMGFSTFLNSSDLTKERRKQYVSIIQNSGNQLMRIIDDILEISRLETKQVTAQITEVCLNDMLFELFSIFDIRAKQNKVPLYMKKGLANKQSVIKTDPTKLSKVLSNLIENAFKFTNNGFVEFGYLLKDQEIEMYVKDTGIGIASSKHDTIFKRFSQAEKEVSQNAGGLGLGLSIAKENTELLDGNIRVESELGKGTTFFVCIPYNPVNLKDEDVDNAISNTAEAESILKDTILIAEDEEVNYLYVETLLREILNVNCNILHAKNGQEAIDICVKHDEITLVLMDLKMPKIDGFEAIRQIKKIKPKLPIIAQTAYSSPDDEEKVINMGCVGYLSKPIKIGDFTKIIGEYISTT